MDHRFDKEVGRPGGHEIEWWMLVIADKDMWGDGRLAGLKRYPTSHRN
jgi:hypothetical protein